MPSQNKIYESHPAILIRLTLWCLILVQSATHACDGWRVLPIRSQKEFELGRIGGEATQHLHGIARSPSHPDIMYWSQDVGQVWKSTNAGETWLKTTGKGLYLRYGQSIEVDPVDPKIVFVIVDNVWNRMAEDYEGVYRSIDGGDSWEFVLPTAVNFVHNANPITHRMYKHNIAYDPASVEASGARTWYAAFVENGLYRSEDYGRNWTRVADLRDHETLYGIQAHPSDGKTVYIASRDGLFAYSPENGLRPLGDIPCGAVSSVAVHPEGQIMYATLMYKKWSQYGDYKKGDTVYHKAKYYRCLVDHKENAPDTSTNIWEKLSTKEGLYQSQNAGNRFTLLKECDVQNVFMNPGYPKILYLVGATKDASTWITHDGGKNWFKNTKVISAPGLDRDKWQQRIYGNTGIVPNPNNKEEAIAFSSSHIYKTTDGGKSFVESSNLFTGYAWWINAGAAFDTYDPDRMMFLLCDVTMAITHNGGNYFIRRSGETWEWLRQGRIPWIGAYAGDFQPVQGSQLIVGSVGNYFRTKLMRSTDEGKTWKLVTNDIEPNLFVKFHTKDPDIIYAGKRISRDAGITFNRVDFGKYNHLRPEIFGMCLERPDTTYALDSRGRFRIFRSDDKAKTWYLCDKLEWKMQRTDSIPTFAVDPQNPDKVYTLDKDGDLAAGTWNHNVKRMLWTRLRVLARVKTRKNLNNYVRTVAVDPKHSEVIYAGMSASGISNVWRSTDKGETWKDVSYNLPRMGIQAMAVNPHTGELFVGSACGTWILQPPYESQTPIYDKCAPSK